MQGIVNRRRGGFARGAVLAGAVGTAVNLVISVVMVPLLLKMWGANEYGLWVATMSLFGLSTSLDLGHQAYIGNELVKLQRTDVASSERLLGSAVRGALFLGLLEVAVAAVFWLGGAMNAVLGLPPEMVQTSWGGAFVFLVGTWALTGSVGGILVRLYSAGEHYAVGQWWGVLFRIGQAASTGAVASLGGSIPSAVVAHGATTVACSFPLFLDLRRRFPILRQAIRAGSLREAWTGLRKGAVLTTIGICAQGQNSGLVVVVSSILGGVGAASFATSRTAANLFLQLASIVGGPLTPALVRAVAEGRRADVRRDVVASQFVTVGATTMTILIGSLMMPAIYSVWTARTLRLDGMLFCGLALGVLARCAGTPFLGLLVGLNKLREQGIIAVLQVGITVPGVFLVAREWGLTGCGWVIGLSEVLLGFVLPVWFTRHEIGLLALSDAKELLGAPLGQMIALGLMGLVWDGQLAVRVAAAGFAIGFVAVLTTWQWRRLPAEYRERLIGVLHGA
jgi:O-antigen/teichoic acid export membrane protein